MKKILFTLTIIVLLFSCSDDIATIPNETEISEIEKVEKEPIICLINSEAYPQFPDGERAMMDFIYKNLRYPVVCIEGCVKERVTIRFAVLEDGAIDSIEVLRGLSSSHDREAVRVIKMMPNWKPATQNGIPVKSHYTIPILFRWR